MLNRFLFDRCCPVRRAVTGTRGSDYGNRYCSHERDETVHRRTGR